MICAFMLVVASFGSSLASEGEKKALSVDEQAVVALYAAYHDTWMPNDESVPDAVIGLFAEDGAILPHHGDPIVSGRNNIRNHWFPDNQISGTVDVFSNTLERVEVAGALGYVYGRFYLEITYQGEITRFESNQMMIARKQSDLWKIVAVI